MSPTTDKGHPTFHQNSSLLYSRAFSPIQQPPSTEDNQRYANEARDRGVQLERPKNLNMITIGGIVVAGLSLIFVGLSYQQSRRALEIDQRPWVALAEYLREHGHPKYLRSRRRL